MSTLLLLVLALSTTVVGQGIQKGSITNWSALHVTRDLASVTDFLPHNGDWHEFDRKAGQKSKQSIAVKFDQQCKNLPTHEGKLNNTFETRIFLSLIETLGDMASSRTGDRSGTAELTGALRGLISSVDIQRAHRSVYDVVKSFVKLAVNRGLFRNVHELEFLHPESTEDSHHLRRIRAEAVLSFPDYYYRVGRSRTLPCPFRGSFPLSWPILDETGAIGFIDVMAVPAARKKDGSYQITSPRFNFSTFSIAKELFLKENNWVVKDIERINGKNQNEPNTVTISNFTLYGIEMPSEVRNCTSHYILNQCRIYDFTAREALCLEWGSRCRVRTAIKLPATGTKEITHMLYIPSKAFAGNLGNGTSQKLLQERSGDLFESQRASMTLAELKVSERLDLMMRTKQFYLPQLEEDHDDLTFVVIVLVFVSEWMLSLSLLWSKLVNRIFIKVCGLRRESCVRSYEKMVKRFTQQLALLIPALVGFIPLVIGLWQTARRKNAVVGILGSSWAEKNYLASNDPELESLNLAGGSSLGFTVEFRELSAFDSLFSKYLIATCIASVLLGLPVSLLIFQGITLVKTGRKSRVKEALRGSEGEPIESLRG